jgi:SAM-dependent methyltransferase
MPYDANYFRMAYGQDYERRNPRYKWQSFLRELLKYRTGGNLLEVGCSFGLFLREAASHFNCIGCDISEHAVIQARRKLSPEVRLFCGALGQLPLNCTFDVIAVFDVIEHVADLQQVFNDMERLLRPKGLLIFTVPVYDGPLGWLVNQLRMQNQIIVYARPK